MTSSQENTEGQNLHLVYKKMGETPLERAQRFQADHPEFRDSKITYAGRLDPMAEGLLILLTNDAVNAKENFLNLSKTYEVEVLWGISTDTQDLLGLVSSTNSKVPEENDVVQYLLGAIKKFEQKYPAYSSKPVDSKPLFAWAREGKIDEVSIPSHEVEVMSANFTERKNISKKDLLSEIETRIALVKGDFRQNEILEKWQETLEGIHGEDFVVDRMCMEVSGGFYVRQFVTDMAESFGAVATTFHIKRTKVGEFEI